MSRFVRALSWVLIAFRGAASVILVLDAADGTASAAFLPLFIAAFLSDVFDGIIARRLSVDTAALRLADSCADIALYAAVAASAWIARRSLVEPYVLPVSVVIGAQALSWLVDLVKYRRISSYHAWSAKAWGIAQATAAVALFGFDRAGPWLWPAIVLGVANNIECIVITMMLPRWTHDVPSIAHARRVRKKQLETRA